MDREHIMTAAEEKYHSINDNIAHSAYVLKLLEQRVKK